MEIAGILHFDPLCKQRLIRWLKEQALLPDVPLEFVAVEWDNELFELVKSQRLLMRKLVEETWLDAQPSFLDVFAEALAFEGDTHLKVFPTVETLWLDQRRIVNDRKIITNYVRERIEVYRSYLPNPVPYLDQNVLEGMSCEAWRRVGKRQVGGTPRDFKFATLILERIKEARTGWAIAIVGADHASENSDSLRSRLENAGIHCFVVEMRRDGEMG